MRKFKFKFSAVFYVLFGIIYALALTALIWNGIRLFTAVAGEIELNVYNAISLGLSILLPILFIILITAAIISSAYNISGEKLTVNFGFLKDSFKISDIESIIKNVRYSTLYISFKDGSGYKIYQSFRRCRDTLPSRRETLRYQEDR